MNGLVLGLLLIALCGCVAQQNGLSFVEIVKEDVSCSNGICSTEYLLASDGSLVKRVLRPMGQADWISMEAVRLPQAQADSIFASLEGASESLDAGCERCDQYNFFFADGSKTVRRNVRLDANEAAALADLDALWNRFESISLSPLPHDDFFVQLVTQGRDNKFVDHHFFKSGVVIRSEFGLGNGELLSARLEKDPQKAASVIAAVSADYFVSPIDQPCPSGVGFGSLVVHSGTRTAYRDFCFAGKKADALFVQLERDWK
jgi:hypothetical protein